MGKSSWDKFTFVALFHTRRTVMRKFIYTCSTPPPTLPPLQCWTRVHAISPEFQHCIGGRGKQRILKRITEFF